MMLLIFTIKVLLSGDVTIDVTDLRENTKYSDGYSDGHECIKIFWKIVGTMTEEEKKLLLKFVTCCTRAPLFGFKVGIAHLCMLYWTRDQIFHVNLFDG